MALDSVDETAGGAPLASQDVAAGRAESHRRAYPEGWFQAAYSDDLAAGDVQRLYYFGQELVLFRTKAGRAQILDAYCAHLGAHLGVGGAVSGEHLVCPYHAWEYATDGRCAAIPYSEGLPKRGAAVRAWPTEERSGLILFWHSPFDRPPQWEPPHLPEYGEPEWGDYFLRQSYQVRTTAYEIIENIADTVHGKYVHGGRSIPDVDFLMQGPTMRAELHTDLPSVGGKQVNTVICHGLGLVENRATGHAEKAFFSANTPIDRDQVHVRFSMLAKRSSEVSMHSAKATVLEFEKDIPIWNAKIFRAAPLLVKEDGPILKYRLWAQQFLAEV